MAMDLSFYAVAAPAVVLLGLSKSGLSGLGALAVPLMALSIPPIEAAAITLPIMVVQDWVGVYAFRREVDGRNLAILLPAALIGVVLAFFLAAHVSEDMVRLAVGVVSVGFVALMVARDRLLAAHPAKAKVAPGLFWGALAGFASFVSHAGGPPFLVYVMPQRLSTPVFAGTSVLFFAAVNLMKVPPYLLLGQFSRAHLLISLTLLPLAIVSTLAGVWIVRRVRPEKFYNAVLILTFGLGVKLIYDAVRPLIG
ncbi:MAG: sulfite exporter TauE/SafE family protein [Pseudomonadota bacterium]|nr:sulfite exporter TauE/SafE family protein [Pseudomonadota bacterium]